MSLGAKHGMAASRRASSFTAEVSDEPVLAVVPSTASEAPGELALAGRMLRPLTLALCCAWVGFLAIGGAWHPDETMHAHAAWLMGAEGAVPLRDFFEHHMPLLWHVLKVYFLAGANGPEVLYFGRSVVIACAVSFVCGLFFLARRRAGAPSDAGLVASLAIAAFVSLTFLFPTTMLIRPEALALPFVMWSLALFGSGQPSVESARRLAVRDLAAGVLLGIAAYATPRAIYLTGLYPLLAWGGMAAAQSRLPARALSLALGFALAWAMLPPLLGDEYAYVKFALSFSMHVQRIGDDLGDVRAGAMRTLFSGWAWLTPVGLLLYFLALAVPDEKKRLVLAHYFHLALVLAATMASNWNALLSHNAFAAMVCVAVAVVELGRHVAWARYEKARPCVVAIGTLLLVLASAVVVHTAAFRETLPRSVAVRRQLLALLRPGDDILLYYGLHPISYRERGYYIDGLTDAPERLCKAVRTWQGRPSLPRCDFFESFTARVPRLVDDSLLTVIAPARRPEVERFLRRSYRRVALEGRAGEAGIKEVLVRVY